MAKPKKPGKSTKPVSKAVGKYRVPGGGNIRIGSDYFTLAQLQATFDCLELSLDVHSMTPDQFAALEAFFDVPGGFTVVAKKVGTPGGGP